MRSPDLITTSARLVVSFPYFSDVQAETHEINMSSPASGLASCGRQAASRPDAQRKEALAPRYTAS